MCYCPYRLKTVTILVIQHNGPSDTHSKETVSDIFCTIQSSGNMCTEFNGGKGANIEINGRACYLIRIVKVKEWPVGL